MSLIIVQKEELEALLISELSAWNAVTGTNPNFNAYEFNPSTVDVDKLKADGYYAHFESWIAGIQYKKLLEYLDKYIYNSVSAEE
jgi:hypothetical protein